MSRVPVDVDAPADETVGVGTEDANGAPRPGPSSGSGNGRRRPDSVQIEIEREITKRHLIEAISSVVVVILYMAFTLLRDRDSGVVVLDDADRGPQDDWDEA